MKAAAKSPRAIAPARSRASSPPDPVERLRETIISSRNVENISIFDSPEHSDDRTILVPVADTAFEPALRSGEFAIVDVSNTEPAAEDGLFLVSIGESTPGRRCMRFVVLRHFKLDLGCSARCSGPHWSFCFGVRPIFSGDGRKAYTLSGDGPLCDAFLRTKIIGRVVGVLGDGERTLNWKTAYTGARQ